MKIFFDKDAGDGKVGGNGGQAVDVLKVGDKEYSAEDVGGILKELGGLKAHEQTISRLGSMAQTFGLEVDQFADQGLAALRVINDLINKEVIDETGKVIEKITPKDKGDKGGEDDDGDDDLFKLNLSDDDDVKGKNKGKGMSDRLVETMERIMAPLTETVKTLSERVDKSEVVTSGMLEENFANKIVTKFPNLTADDAKQVFVRARADKTKTLWEHAEEVSKAKVATEGELEKKFAEKYGLNIEQLNENLIREQETKNGAPPAKEGVKITFRKGIKGGVHPGELAGAYLKQKIG